MPKSTDRKRMAYSTYRYTYNIRKLSVNKRSFPFSMNIKFVLLKRFRCLLLCIGTNKQNITFRQNDYNYRDTRQFGFKII